MGNTTADRCVAAELACIRERESALPFRVESLTSRKWRVEIDAPADTPWAGQSAVLEVRFVGSYPFRPPYVTVSSDLSHPVLFKRAVLLSPRRGAAQWSPVATLEVQVIYRAWGLLYASPHRPCRSLTCEAGARRAAARAVSRFSDEWLLRARGMSSAPASQLDACGLIKRTQVGLLDFLLEAQGRSDAWRTGLYVVLFVSSVL
jgi:Ubiquitin-protein ligase